MHDVEANLQFSQVAFGRGRQKMGVVVYILKELLVDQLEDSKRILFSKDQDAKDS